MTDYIPIICFVAGTVTGAVLTYIGFKLGFRASFEIRQSKDYPEDEGKGLFKKPQEPAEFDILKKDEDVN
jgi:hypothetical protein